MPPRNYGGYDGGYAKAREREQMAEAKQAFGPRQRDLPCPIEKEGCGKCKGSTSCKEGWCFGDLNYAYKTKPNKQVIPSSHVDRVTNDERSQQ